MKLITLAVLFLSVAATAQQTAPTELYIRQQLTNVKVTEAQIRWGRTSGTITMKVEFVNETCGAQEDKDLVVQQRDITPKALHHSKDHRSLAVDLFQILPDGKGCLSNSDPVQKTVWLYDISPAYSDITVNGIQVH